MANVSEHASSANAPPAPRVDLADPTARAEWLAAMRDQAADIIAAGLDATAPPAMRDLGRRAARDIITDAARAMDELFAAVGCAGVPSRDRSAGGTR